MMDLALRSFFVLALLASPSLAQTTWYVDDDATPPGSGTQTDPFPTVVAAVDAAGTGDTILVAPGSYGTFHVTKRIHVRSTDGPEVTTVVGANITVGSGYGQDQYLLEGFTLTGGAQWAVRLFTGVVRRCIIRDNPGTGLFIDGNPLIEETTITRNGIGLRGYHLGWWGTFRNTIIWGNLDDIDGPPGYTTCENCAGVSWCMDTEECIFGPPVFWDLQESDVHLHPDSPCIGAGGSGVPDIGALLYDATYAPTPVRYCEGAPNSLGGGARMGWSGTSNLTTNGFHLAVSGAAADQPGMFFYGPSAVQLPFADGFRCVGGPTFRVRPVLQTDGVGAAAAHLDLDAPPADSGPGMIDLGDFWYFQFWYRDPAGPGGTGSNLSDGLRVGFGG